MTPLCTLEAQRDALDSPWMVTMAIKGDIRVGDWVPTAHLCLCEVLVGPQQIGGDEALPRPDLCHEAIEADVEDL